MKNQRILHDSPVTTGAVIGPASLSDGKWGYRMDRLRRLRLALDPIVMLYRYVIVPFPAAINESLGVKKLGPISPTSGPKMAVRMVRIGPPSLRLAGQNGAKTQIKAGELNSPRPLLIQLPGVNRRRCMRRFESAQRALTSFA